jgi:hypothetical protein
MTCYRWSHGHCTFTDDECRYFHMETGKLGSPDGAECRLPKYSNPPLTCFWWFETRFCKLSDEECGFAHWNTGLIANKDKGAPPRRVSRSRSPQAVRKASSTGVVLPRSQLTCYFWSRGKCRFSDETCDYAHRQCEVAALPPPGFGSLSPDPPSPEGSDSDPMEVDSTHFRRQSESMMEPSQPESPGPLSPRLIALHTEQDRQPPPIDHAYLVDLAIPSADDGKKTVNVSVQLAFRSAEEKLDFSDSLETALTSQADDKLSGTSSTRLFNVDRSITAEDMEKFSTIGIEDVLFSGDVFPTQDSTEAVIRYADGLALQTGGSLTYFPSLSNPKFTLIITPTPHRMKAWRFLPTKFTSAPNAYLQFVVVKPLSRALADLSLTAVPLTHNPISHAEILFSKIFNTGLHDLFVYPHKDEPPLEKDVLLVFPADLPADIQLVTRIFEAYGCNVYFGHKPGVFSRFTRTIERGIVVFHPFIQHFHKIPGLATLVGNKRYNFHVIGPDLQLLWRNQQPRMEYVHRWLFPHGGVIFLTDYLLEYVPKRTLEILQHFTKKRWKNSPTKGWRLFFRPGIKDWAWELAERNKNAAAMGNDYT